jgi:transposase
VVIPQGIGQVRRALPGILEDADKGLTTLCRELLNERYEQLGALDEQIRHYDQRIAQVFKAHDACRQWAAVAGIGPLIATAFWAAVGDARAFANGRQVAAWLGLVPKQQSSGGKTVLLGISKRGDRYLRMLLIHGARAAVRYAANKTDAHSAWINQLKARRGVNVAAVALANKNARVLWALMAHHEPYQQAA